MLSKNEMVRAKASIEKLYDCIVDIYASEAYIKTNGATGHKWTPIYTRVPCRRSHKKIASMNMGTDFAAMTSTVTIYMQPDIKVPPGSILLITHKDEVIKYKQSGISAVYDTHQEIPVEIAEEVA